MRNFLLFASILISITSLCQPTKNSNPALAEIIPNGKWIDLTYSFSKETLYWPSVSSPFKLDTVFHGRTSGGYFYSAYSYGAPEHGGTHLDAPVHFAEGKHAVDEIPIDQLCGPAVVIDVSKKVSSNRDYLISVEDVLTWEKENGKIPDGAILLFKTGFGKYYPDADLYLGTNEKGPAGIAKLHFPGIDPLLSEWLVNNRKIKAVGLDTASVDYGQSKEFKTHQILNAANIAGFENVANLELLPATGSYVIALPMKIKGGSGAPLRIIAWVGK